MSDEPMMPPSAMRVIRLCAEQREEAIRQRDELRAVLAPLLDDPYEQFNTAGYECDEIDHRCRFCEMAMVWTRTWTGRRNARGRKINEWADATPHTSDCPVLRRDALLGRENG